MTAKKKATTLPEATEGTTLPEAIGGTTLPEATEGTTLPEAIGGTALPEATEGTTLPEAIGGTALPEAIGGTALPEATEGTALPEATEGTTLPEAIGGTAPPEVIGGTAPPDLTKVDPNLMVEPIVDSPSVTRAELVAAITNIEAGNNPFGRAALVKLIESLGGKAVDLVGGGTEVELYRVYVAHPGPMERGLTLWCSAARRKLLEGNIQ